MTTRVTMQDGVAGFDGYRITAEIENRLNPRDTSGAIQAAIHDIAVEYAEKWTEDNLVEIYKSIDAKAISNMIMLEAAKQIKNNILETK